MHNLYDHRKSHDAKLSIPTPCLLPTNPLHLFLPASLALLFYHRRRQYGGHSCQIYPCLLRHYSSEKWGRLWSDLHFPGSLRKQYLKHAVMNDTLRYNQAPENSSFPHWTVHLCKTRPCKFSLCSFFTRSSWFPPFGQLPWKSLCY